MYIAVLNNQEDFNAKLSGLASVIDIDGESDDGEVVQGDGAQAAGSLFLLYTEVLATKSAAIIALS